jgi:hypothetical protein
MPTRLWSGTGAGTAFAKFMRDARGATEISCAV